MTFVPQAAPSGTPTAAGPYSTLVLRRPDGQLTNVSIDNTNALVFTPQNPVVTPPQNPGPVGSTTVTINNNTNIGTGNDQVSYSGAWVALNDTVNPNTHYSSTTNDTFTIPFTGTAISLVGRKHPSGGIGSYSLDGANPVTFDTYAAADTNDATWMSLSGLTNTAHTLVVKVTGTKNASSAAVNIAPNGDFETGTLFTGFGNGTVSFDTAHVISGTKALKLAISNTTAYWTTGNRTDNSDWWIPVTPLTTYVASVYGYADATMGVQLEIDWIDGNTPGNFLSNTLSTSTSATLNGSKRFSVSGTAPAGAAWAVISCNISATTAGANFWSDQLQFEVGSSPSAWKAPAATTLDWEYASVTVPSGALVAPVQSALATAGSGGTFAAGTYYYVVTATDSSGNETTASNERSIAVSANGTVTVTWAASTGAAGYKIYRGTSVGGENVRVGTTTTDLTLTDTGGAGTSASPPGSNVTIPFDANGIAVTSLTISSSTGDTNGVVTGTLKIIGNRANIAIQDLCISVRDHTNTNSSALDFPHLNSQTVGTTELAPASQTVTLSTADTYTFYVSYNLGGTWFPLQSIVRTLTITQASTGPNNGGTAGANPMLTTGARSGLPWNSGSQNVGQNATQPATITAARTYMEQRGKLEDAIQQAQYVNGYTSIDGDLTTLHGLPNDCIATIDLPPWCSDTTFASSWSHIATGAEDSHFFNAGVNYANYCHASRGDRPAVLRLGWEFNGNWYVHSAGKNGDTNTTFIAGWRRAAQQIKAGAASVGHANLVVVSWSMSGLDNYWGNPLTTQYPGDDVVDLIGIDFYDWGMLGASASTATTFGWKTNLDTLMTFCVNHGKWMAVDEWGLHHTGAPGEGGDNPNFITGFYNWLRALNPLLSNQPTYKRLAYEQYFQDDTVGNVQSSVWSPNTNNNPNSRVRYGTELHA